MTILLQEAAVPSLGPVSFTNDRATAQRVDFGLRRSIASDVRPARSTARPSRGA
ncbi:hypothetical protein [Streptomyces hygroscopicus]|uniref:hypothetical protein n=1 Tax=Streptomyces hygroscopicus TaxID=1912 RepID=UPI000B023516|nr:hypothetical protein [Streptomyces hygroscopicus]MBW8091904.1 hypothetical protein [Streptomyces hygroscopicus subsp. hygroscopicus]